MVHFCKIAKMMRRDIEIPHEKQKSVNDVYPLILGWSADATIFSQKKRYLRTCKNHLRTSRSDIY